MLSKINSSNLFLSTSDLHVTKLNFTNKENNYNEILPSNIKKFLNIRKYHLITGLKHLQDSGFLWLYNNFQVNTWNHNQTLFNTTNTNKVITYYGQLFANLSKISKKLILDFWWLINFEKEFNHEHKHSQLNITFEKLKLLNKKFFFLKKLVNNSETTVFTSTNYDIRKNSLILIFQIDECLMDSNDKQKINYECANLGEKMITGLIPFLVLAADVKEHIRRQIIIFLKKFDEVIMNIENNVQNLALHYNWKTFFEKDSKIFLSTLYDIINNAFKEKNSFLFLFSNRKLQELKNYFFKILLIIEKNYLWYCNNALAFLKNLRSDFTCYFNLLQNEISWKNSLYFTSVFNHIIAKNEQEIYNLTWQLNQAFVNNSDIVNIYQNPHQLLQEIRNNKTTSLDKIITTEIKEIKAHVKESNPQYVATLYLFTFVVLAPLLFHFDPPLIPKMFNTFQEIEVDESEVWSLPRLSIVSQDITNDFNIYLRMAQKKLFPYFDNIYSSQITAVEMDILHNQQSIFNEPVVNHDANLDELADFNEANVENDEESDSELALTGDKQEINGETNEAEIMTDNSEEIVMEQKEKTQLGNREGELNMNDRKTLSNELLFEQDETEQILPEQEQIGETDMSASGSSVDTNQLWPSLTRREKINFNEKDFDYEELFFTEEKDDEEDFVLKAKLATIDDSSENFFFEEKGELEFLNLQENIILSEDAETDLNYIFNEKENEEFKNEDFDYYLLQEKSEEEKLPLMKAALQQAQSSSPNNSNNSTINTNYLKVLVVVLGVVFGFLPFVVLGLYFSKKNSSSKKNKTSSSALRLANREKKILLSKTVKPCESDADEFNKTEINKLLFTYKQNSVNLKNVL